MMDMHSLIHHAPVAPASESGGLAGSSISGGSAILNNNNNNNNSGMRFASGAVLPGLRAQFPSAAASLPIRLPSIRAGSAPGDCRGVVRPLTPPQDLRRSPTAVSLASPPTAAAQTTTMPQTPLAPLRFIIPSSHCGPAPLTHAFLGSEPSAFSPARAEREQQTAPATPPRQHQQFQQHEHEQHAQQTASPAGAGSDAESPSGGEAPEKKAAAKRSRAAKSSTRSTKSKARPGLRKGKWTDEESRYATQLTHYFKEGLLPLERGTMLRLYLSQKLNCEPMRITKKFTGVECIGKQVFRPCSPTPESRVRLMQAQLELVALEAAFLKKVQENHEEAPASSSTSSTTNNSSSSSSAPRASALSAASAAAAAGSSTDDEEGFTSDSSSASSPSLARVGVLGVAAAPAAAGVAKGSGAAADAADSASAVGLLLDFFYKANHRGEPEAEGATSGSESEGVAGSPTKRIRALSISCSGPSDAFAKRSRVGSISVAAP